MRSAPVIDHRDLLDAGYGAELRARLFGIELALHVLGRVFEKRYAGKATLLRAVMNEPIFADI